MPARRALIGERASAIGVDWLVPAGAGLEGGCARTIMAGAGTLPLLLLLAAAGAAGRGKPEVP